MHNLTDPAGTGNVSVFDSGYEPGLETLDTYWWERVCSWVTADMIVAPTADEPLEVNVTVSFSFQGVASPAQEDGFGAGPEFNPYWGFSYTGTIATRQSPKP